MSIATKTGDSGTTALMFGHRVAKDSLRVEAYGCVDEMNASLGMARALGGEKFVNEWILSIQKELVTLMGELSVAPQDRERYQKKGYGLVTTEMVDRLTSLVDELEENHKISFDGWATPGKTTASASMDVARTVCRRAERRVMALHASEPVNPEVIRYLNRLSDLCWLIARYLETE